MISLDYYYYYRLMHDCKGQAPCTGYTQCVSERFMWFGLIGLVRFYWVRGIMTSVMQCLPAQLQDVPTSALASFNESVVVQVSLATQAKSKRPKQHLQLPKAQIFSIEDLPDEIITALMYQNLLHRDLCSLAQVSWRYRHLSVSTASKLDRLGIRAPGSPLISVNFCL